MKLSQQLLFSLLMCMALTAQAVSQDVQVDLLMSKITALLKAEKPAEALPYFAELERMEPTLPKPLPESFHFYYIQSLDKAGDTGKALGRADAYLERYGKKGKNYDNVIAVMSRLQIEKRNGLAVIMVRIPGESFEIGKYEVTQAEWEAVMGSNPSRFKGCDTCPVEMVSWNNVQDYLKKLNELTGKQYRLPTEREWEIACDGGNAQEYCGSGNVDAVAWYYSNSGGKPHPVGQKQANGYGLHDMSGNVQEWTQDCYDGNCSERVLRGGSWYSAPQGARAAYRARDVPALRDLYHGFRLARTLP